jgi:hypothetical protein
MILDLVLLVLILNAMRADDLRIWIQSQGHKIEWKPKPKMLGLLRQAQKIWDNRGQQSFQSNASRVTRKKGFTYPQCRGDIDQMNAVTLVSWIRSKGYIVTGQQRVKACVLAQAKINLEGGRVKEVEENRAQKRPIYHLQRMDL